MAEVPLLLISSGKANGPDLTIVKDELKSKAKQLRCCLPLQELLLETGDVLSH